jgi:FtsZ-binding cell division protein ZapB
MGEQIKRLANEKIKIEKAAG